MVTVVNEPLSILRQTLIICLAQEYPLIDLPFTSWMKADNWPPRSTTNTSGARTDLVTQKPEI
jgi:hypothetical protein